MIVLSNLDVANLLPVLYSNVAQATPGTGPSRTPNTFPSGSLNHAPRTGPIWAMKLVVFGDSYFSKATPRAVRSRTTLSTSSTRPQRASRRSDACAGGGG